jgi:enoyl-CoA hydratase
MSSELSVVMRRDGRIGRILLNRPRALNALDRQMIGLIGSALDGWRDDPRIHAVVIEAEGGRAFCAGGDIRDIRDLVLAGRFADVAEYFREEYALNHAISAYPKPYIALIDGICLGGGIGVSVHGRMVVATEAAGFAMPETAIGFFPDIGASFFLPRLAGHLGMYLALTGTRMTGGDSVQAGLATHFVRRDRLAALSAALAADGVGVLAGFAEPPPPFSLAEHRAAIDRCFSAETVAAIFDRLEAESTEWAAATLRTLRTMSPSALVWTHRLITAGGDRSLAECLQAELALTKTVTVYPDFAEGVRAMVVDKDRAPRWRPARLEEVDIDAISGLFV